MVVIIHVFAPAFAWRGVCVIERENESCAYFSFLNKRRPLVFARWLGAMPLVQWPIIPKTNIHCSRQGSALKTHTSFSFCPPRSYWILKCRCKDTVNKCLPFSVPMAKKDENKAEQVQEHINCQRKLSDQCFCINDEPIYHLWQRSESKAWECWYNATL